MTLQKRIQQCPKCSEGRKKKSAPCCSVIEFPSGLSYKCFHCGYKEFVSDKSGLDKSAPTESVDQLPAVEIKDGTTPWEDEITTFYSYYVDKKLMYYVARRGSGNDKWIRPVYLSDEGWVMGSPNLSTLYRSELLHSDERPVIVVEGEKAADAAAMIFKNADVVSWQGGANNYTAGNWSLLSGRKVIIWPDNDVPGIQAAEGIANLLSAKEVYIIDVSSLPAKADLADNLDRQVIIDLYKSAKLVETDYAPGEMNPSLLTTLHSKEIKYITTGWPTLDKHVKLPPTGVVVVSGRTNHGKTALMINLALNIAQKTDKTVLYLTLEFPVEELNLRMIKTLDGKSYSPSGWEDDSIYNTHLAKLSTQSAKTYYNLLISRKLRVADSTITMPELVKIMNKCKDSGKELVVFIDYLQIIPLQDGNKARYEKLKDMIELIRRTANKNSQLLIGGSQLTAGESPLLDQVRESKDLENTAALHLKLWNKQKARDDKEKELYSTIPGDIIVTVEKSRQNGANGKIFGFNLTNGCQMAPAIEVKAEF